MSKYMKDGTKRIVSSYRILLNIETVEAYEALQDSSKPSLSKLLSTLLKDWVTDQELKQEFKRLS